MFIGSPLTWLRVVVLCRLVGMMSLKVDGVYRKSLDLVELLCCVDL